jgi:adenosine deaminase
VNFRALPKVELHRHLEGSVRFGTLRELAREVGLDLPDRELRRRTSMRGEKPGFPRFLSKFELYRGLYPSREWVERVAFEAAEDAKLEGVVHLELRFSPAHFGRRMKAKGEDVAAWVERGARRAGISLSFIATFGRDFSLKENEPTARAVRGTDVFSGLDLAGDESKSAMPFRPLFAKLGLPVTLHAGEGGGARNVRQAIESFGALRVGHGLRVLEDPRVVELARRRSVVFEVCPTSEIQTGVARSWGQHPARRLVRAGLPVSLNTDDPSVCGVGLDTEFRNAARLGLGRAELAACTAVAAAAAFLPPARKRALYREVVSGWLTRSAERRASR